ncbi:AAA family ATPase [Frondihabitans cladoniiphilus]
MSDDSSPTFVRQPIRGVNEHPDSPLPRDRWPATLAPVRSVLDHGLELGPITVFVGENGSGKSTLVEGIAGAYGMGVEGGSTGSRHSTRATESPLWESLRLSRGIGGSKRGYFLRAETMHSFYTYLEQNPGRPEPRFHEMSHGESFLELVLSRFKGRGLWMLDEPESALSFQGCLALVGALADKIAEGGSQVILSTHSPVLAAIPGATIYEVGEWGLRPSPWSDLGLVTNYKLFFDDPQRFLRHVVG